MVWWEMLIPYHPEWAEKAYQYFFLEENRHFARSQNRFLTVEDCRFLPNVLNAEVLLFSNEDKVCGLVVITNPIPGACSFGVVLDKEDRRKGLSHNILKEIEDYCFNVKGVRILTTDILIEDEWLGRVLEREGFRKGGTIEKYAFVEGAEKDISFYYKHSKRSS